MTIIFDIDGTLVDSTKRHIEVLKTALNNNDINYDKKNVENFVTYKSDGKNTKSFLKEILKLDDELCDKINFFWKENIEKQEYFSSDKLYADVTEVLEYLYNNYNVVFLSARCDQIILRNELNELNILKYCNDLIVVNPYNAKEEKLNVVKKLLLKDCCMIVGDTEVDNYVADTLNIKKYILNRGFRSKSYWENMSINTYDNLLELKECINDKL